TPPQPALKARTTLYSLSVGGAEASQNGLGDLMPTNSVLRSAICHALQRFTADTRRRRGEFYSPRLLCVSAPLRFKHLRATQESIDGVGGELAVLHRLHRQVLSARHAVAAGEHAGKRARAIGVHGAPSVLEIQRLLAAVRQRIGDKRLPDRLEHRVGRQREALAGARQLARAVEPRVLELGGAHPAALAEQARGL